MHGGELIVEVRIPELIEILNSPSTTVVGYILSVDTTATGETKIRPRGSCLLSSVPYLFVSSLPTRRLSSIELLVGPHRQGKG